MIYKRGHFAVCACRACAQKYFVTFASRRDGRVTSSGKDCRQSVQGFAGVFPPFVLACCDWKSSKIGAIFCVLLAMSLLHKTVSCAVEALHPLHVRRRWRAGRGLENQKVSLTVVGFDTRVIGQNEVVVALLEWSGDSKLELYAQEKDLVAESTSSSSGQSSSVDPPADAPPSHHVTSETQHEDTASITQVSVDVGLSNPHPGLEVRTKKKKIKVGDNITCRYAYLKPRFRARELTGVAYTKGTSPPLTVIDLICKDNRDALKVRLLGEEFTILEWHCQLEAEDTATPSVPDLSAGYSAAETTPMQDDEDSDCEESSTQLPVESSRLEQNQTWKPKGQISTDFREGRNWKADLTSRRRLSELQSITPLDLFGLLFPIEFWEQDMLAATNTILMSRTHCNNVVTKHEFKIFLALQLSMTCHSHGDRRIFWQSEPSQPWEPTLRFNQHMSLKRFNEIASCVTLPDAPSRLAQVKLLQNAFNNKMNNEYQPSSEVTLDESMNEWTNFDSGDKIVIVRRKPNPVGNEYHTIADATTNILFNLEMLEAGTEREYNDLGKTVGLVLRMTRSANLWSTNTQIFMDSGFAVLDVLLQLRKHGLHGAICVKKKGSWPRRVTVCDDVVTHCRGLPKVGSCVSREATFSIDGCDARVYLAGYKDVNHVGLILSTFGTTLTLTAEKKLRYNSATKQVSYIQLPDIFQRYYDARNAVDVNNQLRQGVHSIEANVNNHEWGMRQFYFILSICVTNCFLVAQKMFPGKVDYSSNSLAFRGRLAQQLLDTGITTPSPSMSTRLSAKKSQLTHQLILGEQRVRSQQNGKTIYETRRRRCQYCALDGQNRGGKRKTVYLCACNRLPVCEVHFVIHAGLSS
jgi:hypothetical protein